MEEQALVEAVKARGNI